MGAKKRAEQAHRKAMARLDRADQVLSDATARAARRLTEIEDLGVRIGETADRMVEAVHEAERLRAVVEETSQQATRARATAEETWEAAGSTAADLDALIQRQLVDLDGRAEADSQHLERRRIAGDEAVAAAGERALVDLHDRVEELVRGLEQSRDGALERLAVLDATIERRTRELETTVVPLAITVADATPDPPETDDREDAGASDIVAADDASNLRPPNREVPDDADVSSPLAWSATVNRPPDARAPLATLVSDAAPNASSVLVKTSRAQLMSSLTQLARSAADGWVRVELVHGSANGEPSGALRLTVQDISGWWEYHDVPAAPSTFTRRSSVVDIRELCHAIEVEAHTGDLLDMNIGGDVTIGPVLVLTRTAPVPQLAGERRKIERVDLGGSDRDRLVLDSQVGRLVVPSRLASFLRSRRSEEVDLITIDGRPCLSARATTQPHGVPSVVVAPLSEDTEVTSEEAAERRAARASEIGQLIGALSSTSSPDDLASIVANGVGYARRRAAAHPALPAGLVADILRDGTEAMRSAAAGNPSIPLTSIERAASDEAAAVRAAVAGNPNVPPALLLRLARDESTQVRLRVVGNPTLPVEMLPVLGDDPDSGVRAAVAAHEACPAEILVAMAHDPSAVVCAAVAENPNCPVTLLDDLLAVVPEVVLANPRAPEHLLVAGSQVRASQLRAAVAANPATPVRQLQLLARDADPLVAGALASNPTAPAGVRRRARRRTERAGPVATGDDEVAETRALA